MSRKYLTDKEIVQVLDTLADSEVDSEEVLVCGEDSKTEDNILPNEDDSSSSSYEEDCQDSDEYDDDDCLTSRDGTRWKRTSPSAQQRFGF